MHLGCMPPLMPTAAPTRVCFFCLRSRSTEIQLFVVSHFPPAHAWGPNGSCSGASQAATPQVDVEEGDSDEETPQKQAEEEKEATLFRSLTTCARFSTRS